MHISRKFLLGAALVAPLFSMNAQTLLSDFSSGSDWGASTALGGTGAYSFAGNAANFTVSEPGSSDFAYRSYSGAVGSFTSDWSVWVNVNFASPNFGASTAQFINLGLMVTRTGDTLSAGDEGPTFNAFLVESNLYQSGGNVITRDIRTAVFAPNSAVDDEERYAQGAGASASSVRISYDALNQRLTASFDGSGGTSWSDITSLTADVSTWGMTSANTFTISLMGNSGFDVPEVEGIGPALGSGEAMLSNFSGTGLTPVPEPSTYAAMFGVAALGLAAWRRRRQRVAS